MPRFVQTDNWQRYVQVERQIRRKCTSRQGSLSSARKRVLVAAAGLCLALHLTEVIPDTNSELATSIPAVQQAEALAPLPATEELIADIEMPPLPQPGVQPSPVRR